LFYFVVAMAMRRMRRRVVRRPRYRKRSYGMRKRSYGRRYNRGAITGTTSGTSNIASQNFRRKRIPLRVVKRQRYAATNALMHHRSTFTAPFAFNTDTSAGLGKLTACQIIPDNVIAGAIVGAFWTVNGGLVLRHGDDTATDFDQSDLFIRGGVSSLVVTNLSGQGGFARGAPIRVSTWRGRTKGFGAPSSLPQRGIGGTSTTVPVQCDPSLPSGTLTGSIAEDPYRFYSFWDEKTIQLKEGESFERTCAVPPQKVNQRAYWEDGSYRDFWMLSVSTMVSGNAAPYQYVVSDNISFTGDKVN